MTGPGGAGALVAAPRRVLILRFSSVGDVILTSPAVEALARAWPATEIVYAIREGYQGLVEHSPYVNEVVVHRRGEGALAFARRLRATGFDALLDIIAKGLAPPAPVPPLPM